MKRMYVLSALLICVVSNVNAGLFSGLVKNDIAAIKNEVAKMETRVNSKVDMAMQVMTNIRLDMKAQAQGNANAVAALKSEIKNTNNTIDGIQNNTSNVNDTDLMWKIIYGLLGTIGTLIGILFWIIKELFRRDKEKKFYKERALLHIKPDDEESLRRLREEHDKFVKGIKSK